MYMFCPSIMPSFVLKEVSGCAGGQPMRLEYNSRWLNWALY
ncbi:hypothetical protein TSMEX_000081 [Taenia solium]|eukprot:TsM_000116800 transcript=TsM_000116800 gene=TsM_000116800